MKTISISLILLLLPSNVLAENSDESSNDFGVGVGVGALYGNGIGLNINTTSDGNMFYGAASCVQLSSLTGLNCGVGLGWVTTNYLNEENQNHGLGGYLGIVDGENLVNNNGDMYKESYYGIGLSYTYFLNGISQPGLTLGASVHHTFDSSYDTDSTIYIQIGYQF